MAYDDEWRSRLESVVTTEVSGTMMWHRWMLIRLDRSHTIQIAETPSSQPAAPTAVMNNSFLLVIALSVSLMSGLVITPTQLWGVKHSGTERMWLITTTITPDSVVVEHECWLKTFFCNVLYTMRLFLPWAAVGLKWRKWFSQTNDKSQCYLEV